MGSALIGFQLAPVLSEVIVQILQIKVQIIAQSPIAQRGMGRECFPGEDTAKPVSKWQMLISRRFGR